MLPVAHDNLGKTTHISRLVMWSELKPEPEERPGTGPVSASDLLCDLRQRAQSSSLHFSKMYNVGVCNDDF